jgi:hypothetical protein
VTASYGVMVLLKITGRLQKAWNRKVLIAYDRDEAGEKSRP